MLRSLHSLVLSGAIGAAASSKAFAVAESSRAFAAPDASGVAAGGTAGHMLQTLLALIVVLALVFALAWFLRRMRQSSGRAGAAIEVISQATLGAKERAVLLKVGEARVLVGVASGSVRTLHVLTATESAHLDAPVATTGDGATSAAAGAAMPGFAELLRRSLGVK